MNMGGPTMSPMGVSRKPAVGGSAYAALIQSYASLVANWRLGEASGTVAVDAKGGSNGTYLPNSSGVWTGGTLGQAGAINGDADTAALFGGTGGRVEMGVTLATLLGASANVTVAFWAKKNLTAVHSPFGTNDFLDSGNDTEAVTFFDVNDTYWMRMRVGGTDRTLNAGTWANNVWRYIAGTYDGTTVRLLVNGVQIANTPASGSLYASLAPVVIGGRGHYNTPDIYAFSGVIDEVEIYNDALAAASLLANYNAGI